MFDNNSATEELLAFLLGDITSTFLGTTGIYGLASGGGIRPLGFCKGAITQ